LLALAHAPPLPRPRPRFQRGGGKRKRERSWEWTWMWTWEWTWKETVQGAGRRSEERGGRERGKGKCQAEGNPAPVGRVQSAAAQRLSWVQGRSALAGPGQRPDP